MWVKFRSEWVRKGVTQVNGDVLEVEDWEADMLGSLGKAKRCDAPPVAMPEPSDAELLDAAMGEDEPDLDAPQFKSGSVADGEVTALPRAGRKFK